MMSSFDRRVLARFSLRALLLTTTLVAIWLGAKAREASNVKEVSKKIGQLKGRIEFQHEFQGDRFVGDAASVKRTNETGIIPQEWFVTPHHINLFGTEADDDDLAVLKKAKQIQLLSLGLTNITDDGLSTIGALENLRSLGLEKTKITNAGLRNLTSLSQLEELDLSLTSIGDEALIHLQKISSLRYLSLRGTMVTTSGVRAFEDAVPNCKVEW